MPKLAISTRIASGLAANFASKNRRAQTEIKALVRETGVEHHDALYAECPVDTGFMRSKIRLQFSEGGLTYETGLAIEDFTAEGLEPYFIWVIEGTRFRPGNPFFDVVGARMQKRFRARLRPRLRKAFREARG